MLKKPLIALFAGIVLSTAIAAEADSGHFINKLSVNDLNIQFQNIGSDDALTIQYIDNGGTHADPHVEVANASNAPYYHIRERYESGAWGYFAVCSGTQSSCDKFSNTYLGSILVVEPDRSGWQDDNGGSTNKLYGNLDGSVWDYGAAAIYGYSDSTLCLNQAATQGNVNLNMTHDQKFNWSPSHSIDSNLNCGFDISNLNESYQDITTVNYGDTLNYLWNQIPGNPQLYLGSEQIRKSALSISMTKGGGEQMWDIVTTVSKDLGTNSLDFVANPAGPSGQGANPQFDFICDGQSGATKCSDTPTLLISLGRQKDINP